MFARVKRVVELMGLPQDWTSAPSFTVIIPLSTVDIRLAERGLRQALKLQDAVTEICYDLCWDQIFQAIHAKRQANMPLNEKEQQYVAQADRNYIEMVIYKMGIAILYDGDFFGLSDSDRLAFRRLVERYPGCLLVSSTQVFVGRRILTLNPHNEITRHDAKKRIRKIFRAA